MGKLFERNWFVFSLAVLGCTAATIQVVLISEFPAGYPLYHVISVITLFGLGFLLGIWFGKKEYFKVSVKNYYRIQGGIGLYMMLVAVVLMLLRTFCPAVWLVYLVFLLMLTDVATLTGLQLFMGNKVRHTLSVAKFYSIVVTGAILGLLLMFLLLIPFLGGINTPVLAGAINIFVALVFLFTRKKL